MKETQLCSVDACSSSSKHKGLCTKHYFRLRRNGTTERINGYGSYSTIFYAVRNAKQQEADRVIKLLEDEMERLKEWTDYPAVNALMNVRAAVIKGDK